MEDTPGVLEKLVSAIENESLAILYEASGSIENNSEHKKLVRIELLVDATKYYETYGDESLDDHIVLGKLERYLKAISFDDLLLDGKRLRLKVRPMEGLRSAYSLGGRNTTGLITKGKLKIPKDWNLANRRCYLVSDTKDHVLRAYFLHESDDCLYIRVSHNNGAQALSAIAGKLSKDFIVLSSLSRIKVREKEEVEFLLYSATYPTQPQRIELLSRLLSCHCSELDIAIDYWLPDEKVWIPIALQPLTLHATVDEDQTPQCQTTSLLVESQFKNYQAKARSESNHSQSRWYQRKCEAAFDLLLSEQSDRIPSQIFVSYRFRLPELFEVFKDLLTTSDCTVIDGTNPYDKHVDSDAFREVIIKRIYSSSGFIGVWQSDSSATQQEEASWLLWELSVANAFGVPYLLFVHEDFKSSFHKKIFGEKHHIRYKDRLDLKNSAESNLDRFREKVTSFEKEVHRRTRNFNRFSRYN